MTGVEVATRSSITLKGSAQLVSQFFYYGVSSILYQRGVYPPETFEKSQQYGLTVLVPAEEKLKRFLNPLVEQIKLWLEKKDLRRLVVVVSSIQTKEILERWQFDVDTDQTVTATGPNSTKEKSEKKIRQEIGDVIRQITASVTFLPLIECACSFDVLIYTGKEEETPQLWEESGPCLILNSQHVQFRSFSTGIHNVDTKVTYKAEED